jgi:hypothetical protein
MGTRVNGSWLGRGAAWGSALLVILSAPSTVFAQACPLCYQSAAAGSAQFIQALKGGIFVLILPCILICACVTLVTYRKRNACDEDEVSTGD